jgi:tRNA uridine 5-carbamoylmethylation protein Kti12
METPNASNRWDKPLFNVEAHEELPLEEILNAITEGKKPRDPVSTKAVNWK